MSTASVTSDSLTLCMFQTRDHSIITWSVITDWFMFDKSMEDRRGELNLSNWQKRQTIKVYGSVWIWDLSSISCGPLNYSLIKSSWFYQWQERSSVSMYPVPGCWHQSPTWSQWILVQLQLVPASHEFIFLYLSFDLIFLIFNPDVPNISFLIYPPHSHRKETKKV